MIILLFNLTPQSRENSSSRRLC